MFNLTPTVRVLLFINLGLFVLQSYVLPGITTLGSLHPFGSPYFYPWQFVTYMFLHDPNGFGHIFGNMFGLVSFGPMLEQRWGGQRFLLFWMICGIGAGVLYQGVRYYETYGMAQARQELVVAPTGGDFAEYVRKYSNDPYDTRNDIPLAAALQRNPNDEALLAAVRAEAQTLYDAVMNSPHGGMLGASGALFGLLFAFAYLFPNTELMLLFFPFPIKAKYFVFLYALYELYAGIHRTPGDNVAHFAHLGGLLIGFIILKFWENGRQRFY